MSPVSWHIQYELFLVYPNKYITLCTQLKRRVAHEILLFRSPQTSARATEILQGLITFLQKKAYVCTLWLFIGLWLLYIQYGVMRVVRKLAFGVLQPPTATWLSEQSWRWARLTVPPFSPVMKPAFSTAAQMLAGRSRALPAPKYSSKEPH